MTLRSLPRIDRLHFADVTRLPDWHPSPSGGGYPVFGYLIHHPDGPILVDTGIGIGNAVLDDWYGPVVTPLASALAGCGVDVYNVIALVNTHLHFDHCGQNAVLQATPTYVQHAELEATTRPRYTVPEWAHVPEARLRTVDGDEELVDGVTLLSTPGHTPGHQSLLVEGGGRRAVVVGQAAWTEREYRSGIPVADAFQSDAGWHAAAEASLDRLHSLQPLVAYFSHDARAARPRQARAT